MSVKPERTPWTPAEDGILAMLTMYGTGPVLIGKVLNRTTRAVRYRKQALGVFAAPVCRREGCENPVAEGRKGPGRKPELCKDHQRVRPTKAEAKAKADAPNLTLVG